jgi:hypothetical protein
MRAYLSAICLLAAVAVHAAEPLKLQRTAVPRRRRLGDPPGLDRRAGV